MMLETLVELPLNEVNGAKYLKKYSKRSGISTATSFPLFCLPGSSRMRRSKQPGTSLNHSWMPAFETVSQFVFVSFRKFRIRGIIPRDKIYVTSTEGRNLNLLASQRFLIPTCRDWFGATWDSLRVFLTKNTELKYITTMHPVRTDSVKDRRCRPWSLP